VQRNWILISATALLALAVMPARAQHAVVRGRVVDAQTGRPVPGATVHLGSEHAGVADDRGRFEIAHAPSGTQTVWARAMGYGMTASTVQVPDDSVSVELSISPDPVRLAELVATTNRFEVRTRGYARAMRVFRERELSSAASADMREFVLWRSGLRRASCGFGRYCVMVRGRALATRVYIDEVRLPGGMDLLSVYRPFEVARVEVYAGGEEVRVYTKRFMDWAARTNYWPLPLHLGG
jgi:hypothetical protein